MIDIKINKEDLKKVESMLYGIKNGATKAMVTAINETANTCRVQIKKKVGEELNLKASRINQDLNVDKANYQKTQATVRASGEPVGLVNFAGNQLKSGVKVKVKRSGSSKLLKHAFRQVIKGKTEKTNKEHLFWRKYSEKRTGTGTKNAKFFGTLPTKHFYKAPLLRLTGPRIEDILSKDSVLKPIEKESAELLQKKLGQKVDDLLRREGMK